jgi:hypothetical protein
MAPSEAIGPVRAMPFEDITIGVYDVDTWRAENKIPRSSALFHVMEEFESQIQHARTVSIKKGGLPKAKALLIVSYLQPHLKGVTLRITWEDAAGNPLSSELLVPVHENGYPEGGE